MQIVFLFYQGMTGLDAVGPHEILSHLPGALVKRAAQTQGAIHTDSGLVLQADIAIAEVSSADVLLIPGAGSATTLQQHPDILEWIRVIHKSTTWTTSVCTGSLILGAAGLLVGQKATTHWAAMDRLPIFGADPITERVVESGKIITAAGVSAGMDMALTLAAKISGEKVAQTLQLAIEYDPMPPFDVGSPAKADPTLLAGLKQRMVGKFEPLQKTR
jgi:transcriptional regulator GlxA family with amidase domain